MKTTNVCQLPEPKNPSCLQATCASASSQPSSHTVPQVSSWHISTRPSVEVPPWSLIAPSAQVKAEHTTPASWLWSQVLFPNAEVWQSERLCSVPKHWTSLNKIRPMPFVNPEVRAWTAKKLKDYKRDRQLACLSIANLTLMGLYMDKEYRNPRFVDTLKSWLSQRNNSGHLSNQDTFTKVPKVPTLRGSTVAISLDLGNWGEKRIS